MPVQALTIPPSPCLSQRRRWERQGEPVDKRRCKFPLLPPQSSRRSGTRRLSNLFIGVLREEGDRGRMVTG